MLSVVALGTADAITPNMMSTKRHMKPSGEGFSHTMPRRQFIGGTVAGMGMAASGALFGSLAATGAEARPAWRCRLSTSSILFQELSLEEACARIAALGFEAVDIWSAYEKCPHLDDAANRLGPDGLRALLTKHRLSCVPSRSTSAVTPSTPNCWVKWVGASPSRAARGPCKPEELTARMREFLESLKPLLELAEKHNSRLAIENHGAALLDSPDSFKAFVDLNTSPRVGLALAPYHLQASGASVEQVIGICGSQLLFFYAWQNRPETAQLPGHGPTDFTPWLRALARVNYPGFVNVFMHGRVRAEAMSTALMKSRVYLEQCAKT